MDTGSSSDADVTGRVSHIESFASVDGPGVRFAVFLQGCGMRCKYCHNPDTWKADSGDPMSVGEILEEAEHYRPYWGSEGGITVSGGEPLLQIGFLTSLFREAKRRGMNTCIDTSLQTYSEDPDHLRRFDELMSFTDLLLADIKHIDPVKHREITGMDNTNILRCLAHLSEIGKPIWIRYVLVPGITDSTEDLENTRKFISSLKNVKRIEVLPYHTLGVHKYGSLGLDYPLKDVPAPTSEDVRKAVSILNGSK